MIMAEPQVLKCGVVGAGIAGLGAGIALSNAGHDVEVFERSHFMHEIGAAVTITPNAGLVLDHWHFDNQAAKSTILTQLRTYDFQHLKLLHCESFDEIPTKYRHPMASYHRADLHTGLRLLAEQHSAISIKLGNAVTKIDCTTGTIDLADGSCIEKDLIVIADGMKSELASEVLGEENPIHKIGRSTFRTLIPMDRLMADDNIRPLFEGQSPGYFNVTRMETHNFLIAYPCRDNRVLNLALFHNTNNHQENADDWNTEASIEDALKVVEGWHPVWREIIKKADTMKVYTLGERSECMRMVRGKAVLIGDAAHAMAAKYAQGAAMALEDAASLEIMLAGLKIGEGLEKRLSIWEQHRLPRATTTQILSNNTPLTPATTAAVRRHYAGPLLDPLDTPAFHRPVRDFWYGYDVYAHARRARAGLPSLPASFFGSGSGPSVMVMDHQLPSFPPC